MDFINRLPSMIFGDMEEEYIEEQVLSLDREESALFQREIADIYDENDFDREFGVQRKDRDSDALPIVSIDEVSLHDQYDDCWIILYDKVYDITRFLPIHPGSDDVLMEYAGRDATIAFRSVGHSMAAIASLDEFLIGSLPESQRIFNSDGQCQWSIV